MSLPETVSESDFVRIVEHIARVLYKAVGALHGSRDGFAQQVAVWVLEVM